MRVRLEVDLAAAAVGDVRVALGRPEVGVAEHLLHRAEIGAALEQVRRERVAEEVRVDALRLEPGLLGERRRMRNAPARVSGATASVQEELGPVAAVELGPSEREVAARGFRGGASERDEPLLAALAEHADDPVVEVDCALLEPDGLGDAEPGSVQQLDERVVAERCAGTCPVAASISRSVSAGESARGRR